MSSSPNGFMRALVRYSSPKKMRNKLTIIIIIVPLERSHSGDCANRIRQRIFFSIFLWFLLVALRFYKFDLLLP